MGREETNVDIEGIVADLLADLPSNAESEITLPSGETAKIRPITFEEEKQMVTLAKKGEDPSMLLIDRCVSDINPSKVLLIDKIYILFKLRELSFGSVYKFRISCPSCREQQIMNVDINNMPVMSMEDNSEIIEIELPMCKKTVSVRRASLKDEKMVSDTLRLMENLWRFVPVFGGNDDPMVIQAVLSKLPAGDVNRIISVILCEGYGLSTQIMVRCSNCGTESEMDLPLDKNFFSVT